MEPLINVLYNLLWFPLWPLSILLAGSSFNVTKEGTISEEGNKRLTSSLRLAFMDRRKLHHRLKYRLSVENTVFKPGGVWIHALSVGEVLSALPLVRVLSEIKIKACPSIPLYMSSSTASGYRVLKSGASYLDKIFIMPVDAPWLIKDLVNRLKPSVFILVESDVWPNMIRCLKAVGTKCFLVNARMSPSSFCRYRRLNKMGIDVFRSFDAVFVASQRMKELYSHFVPSSKIFFMGNIKWDAVKEKALATEDRIKVMGNLGIKEGIPLWIAGSIHRGEEEIILRAHREILNLFPEAVLILAPRKVPEDVDYFIEACLKYGFTVRRRSFNEKITSPVYIVDTVGELMSFYGISRAAFVGGSLIPKGGHNLLEPAIYGIPVCWGPYIFNFMDVAEILKDSRQGVEVSDYRSFRDFLIHNLSLSHPDFTKSDHRQRLYRLGDSPVLRVLDKILEITVNEAYPPRVPLQ